MMHLNYLNNKSFIEAKYTHKKGNLYWILPSFTMLCRNLASIEIYTLMGKIWSLKTLPVWTFWQIPCLEYIPDDKQQPACPGNKWQNYIFILHDVWLWAQRLLLGRKKRVLWYVFFYFGIFDVFFVLFF